MGRYSGNCVDGVLNRLLNGVEVVVRPVGLSTRRVVHEWLSFQAPKQVRVQDARIGVLYYVLCILIVILYVRAMLRDSTYLRFYTPSLTPNIQLKNPTVKECDPETDDKCNNAPPMFSDLPYCCSRSDHGVAVCKPLENAPPWGEKDDACICPASATYPGNNTYSYQCAYGDATDLGETDPLGAWLFVQTFKLAHFNIISNKTECSWNWGYKSGKPCKKAWEKLAPSIGRFVAGPERFTVRLSHEVDVPALSLHANSFDPTVPGFLKVGSRGEEEEGSEVEKSTPSMQNLCRESDEAVTEPYKGEPTDTPPCYIPVTRNAEKSNSDEFALTTLLEAAGVNLDDVSPGGRHDEHQMSYRMWGFELQLQINWMNSQPWYGLLPNPVYFYHIHINANAKSEMQVKDSLLRESDLARIKRRIEVSRGITIQVVRAGQLAQFDIIYTITQSAAAVVLLGSVLTVLSFFARYVLVDRQYYEILIHEESDNWVDIQKTELLSDDQLTALLAERMLRTDGLRADRVLRLLRTGWRPKHADDDEEMGEEGQPLLHMHEVSEEDGFAASSSSHANERFLPGSP